MTAQPSESRGCLGTLGVLVAMIAIVGGGALAANAVADLPDQPVSVSRGVIVQLPEGWDFAGRTDDESGILLTSGTASLFIETVDGTDERLALSALREEWSTEPTLALGEIEGTDIRPGVAGARFAYSGTIEQIPTAIEGEVIALRGSGYIALFDAWAGMGEYLPARGAVETIVRDVTLP